MLPYILKLIGLLYFQVLRGKNPYTKRYLTLTFLAHSSGLLEQAFRIYLDYKSRKPPANFDFRISHNMLSPKIKVRMVFPALAVELAAIVILDTLKLGNLN